MKTLNNIFANSVKIIGAVLALGVILCACSSVNISVDELCDGINKSVEFETELSQIDKDAAVKLYGLSDDDVTQMSAYISSGGYTDEFAVIKTEPSKVSKVTEKIDLRIQTLKTDYASYRPDEVSKLDNSVVISKGGYIVVCFSNDKSAQEKINELMK